MTDHTAASYLQAALHDGARSVQRKNSALPTNEFLADVVRQSQRAVAGGTDFRNATPPSVKPTGMETFALVLLTVRAAVAP